MDYAFEVSGGQPLGDMPRIINSLSRSDCALLYHLAQLFAFEQFGDYVGRAFMYAQVVDNQNVRMIERRSRACLLFKAAQPILVICVIRRQDFDGDFTVEPCVARAINLTHAARAERRDDFVMIEACAGAYRHCVRSEEHTSELQSLRHLVCSLL